MEWKACLSKPDECGGVSIYGAKDVIIVPNASTTNKDVRVLDGNSAVILTVPLERPPYVSISEKSQSDGFVELPQGDMGGDMGYVAAKGDGTYVPTKGNAQKTHHMTKKNDGPGVDDQTSIRKWDYVPDPGNRNILPGQRAKMTYHVNKGAFQGVENGSRSGLVKFIPPGHRGPALNRLPRRRKTYPPEVAMYWQAGIPGRNRDTAVVNNKDVTFTETWALEKDEGVIIPPDPGQSELPQASLERAG